MSEKANTALVPFVDERLFPKSSALLGEPPYVQAITFGITTANKTMWRSKLDELFCHIVFRFDAQRLKYYRGNGLPLREILEKTSPVEFAKWDNLLIKALELALRRSHMPIKRRKHGWAAFVADFLDEQRQKQLNTLHRS